MDSFEIDLDSECVWLDDAWLNREDLVGKIKGMIDSGDYQIARPSGALESLTRSLAQARLLALRVTPEMSEALNAVSQQSGRPVGAIAREAIASWLAGAGEQPAAQPALRPSDELPAQPALQLTEQAAPAAEQAVQAQVERAAEQPAEPAEQAVAEANPVEAVAAAAQAGDPAPDVTTEPASAEEAANAVALTPKRSGQPEKPELEEVEKRWFGK
jgi:predicted DNA-binding protein